MPKEFYTERDIEDLFKRGITSLEVNDNVSLTELAYEKAGSVGMKLKRDKADNPPGAPVRPYLSQKQSHQAVTPVPPMAAPLTSREGGSSAGAADGSDLQQRIHDAVIARLGTQVDANLLDVIIKRVLTSTGVK